jgi:hypothetical protein
MAAPKDSAERLAFFIKPMIEMIVDNLRTQMVVEFESVLEKLGNIDIRLEVLEKNIEGKKKLPRSETKVANNNNDATPQRDEVQAVAKEEKFPANKMLYFKGRYKAESQYRDQYTTPEMTASMDQDQSITSKTKEDQKLQAKATWVWNFIKANDKGKAETIEREYKDAKDAHTANNRPNQEQAENKTE